MRLVDKIFAGITLLAILSAIGISLVSQKKIEKQELNSYQRIDSMEARQTSLQEKYEDLRDSLKIYRDSITVLNYAPRMTKQHFQDLYKYEAIKHKFHICKRRPTNKKYLYGWIRRILEE